MKKSFEYANELRSRFGLKRSDSSFDIVEIYQKMTESSPEILKEKFSRQHRKLLENTPIVFLVANGLDAVALKVPNANNEAVVAIGPRFSLLLYLMIRTTFWVGDNFEKLDSKVFQSMARNAAALFANFTMNRPLKADDVDGDWFFNENNWDKNVLTAATFGTLCFAICHELAHIKLGHLSSSALSKTGDALTYFKYMQRQEFDADLEGTKLFFEGCPEISFQHSAPLIVCYTIGLLDYFGQILLSDDLQMSSHPHGMNRATRLLKHFKPIMDKSETTHAAIMCGVVEGIVKELKNIDLSDYFAGINLNFNLIPASFPTLELLYQIQKKSKS